MQVFSVTSFDTQARTVYKYNVREQRVDGALHKALELVMVLRRSKVKLAGEALSPKGASHSMRRYDKIDGIVGISFIFAK